ncbi:hypothetical protein HMPREF1556_01276 [Porphyromonas sp. oral taxon 278 str. W7784]|nr:hypothetical protein HMPREF1556_01276 [Porphyromonas sp. oral taxon 278 str. W7784]
MPQSLGSGLGENEAKKWGLSSPLGKRLLKGCPKTYCRSSMRPTVGRSRPTVGFFDDLP